MNFNDNVKRLRLEKGITQDELAKRVGYSGKLYDWLKIRLLSTICKQCVSASQLTGCHIIAHKNRDRHTHFMTVPRYIGF